MEKEKLFSNFPPVSGDEWKEKIVEDLKGADYDRKMIWKTPEGFSVKPFYRKEDLPQGHAAAPGEYPPDLTSNIKPLVFFPEPLPTAPFVNIIGCNYTLT